MKSLIISCDVTFRIKDNYEKLDLFSFKVMESKMRILMMVIVKHKHNKSML